MLNSANNDYAEAYENNYSKVDEVNLIMSRMGTYFHEMVIHAVVNANDYRDDKIMNGSTLPKKTYKYQGRNLDRKIATDRTKIEHLHGQEIESVWYQQYIPKIIEIWRSKNPKINSLEINTHLLDYTI